MKTPLPPYAPETPLKRGAGFITNVSNYGPAPKGWRWRKIGEIDADGDILADGFGEYWRSIHGGSTVCDSYWPIATPVKTSAKRDSKGRFVSTKPALKVELTSATKDEFRREYLESNKVELERIKDCLSGKRDNLYGIFLMRNTAGGYGYWTDRMNNPMQPEDRPFFEALKEFIEAEIARKTPALRSRPTWTSSRTASRPSKRKTPN